MDAQAQGTEKGAGRFQIERLYTGSAADYASGIGNFDEVLTGLILLRKLRRINRIGAVREELALDKEIGRVV